jgi:hypothetical protein
MGINKRNLFVICLAGVIVGSIVLLPFSSATANADEPASKAVASQWEYKIDYLGGGHAKIKDTEAELNKLGSDGWELITIRFNESGSDVAYYKRLKR